MNGHAPHPDDSPPAAISPATKWKLYLGAWGVILLIVLLINPSSVLLVHVFPIGFAGIFPESMSIELVMRAFVIFITLGWTVYGFLTVMLIRSEKQRTFSIVYTVLVILLLLNITGCVRLYEAIQGIE